MVGGGCDFLRTRALHRQDLKRDDDAQNQRRDADQKMGSIHGQLFREPYPDILHPPSLGAPRAVSWLVSKIWTRLGMR